MPEFGFPAQYRQAAMQTLIADLRDRSDDARIESVTERYNDVTQVLDGRVGELMQIEKSLGDLRYYNEAIALSEARSGAMQASLDGIRVSAQEIADVSLTLQTNATPSDLESLSEQARDQLSSVVAQLNVSLGGRSLFAGDNGDNGTIADVDTILAGVTPVLEAGPTATDAYANLTTEFLGAGNFYETSVYLGGTGNAPRTEIASGEVVDYTVRADEEAIRLVVMNLAAIGAAYDPSNNIPDGQRQQLLETASEGLRNSLDGLTTIQSRLGSDQARIADVKSRNAASEASLTLALNDIAGADSYTAAIRLTELETQLEVAFATTSRLAELSLASIR